MLPTAPPEREHMEMGVSVRNVQGVSGNVQGVSGTARVTARVRLGAREMGHRWGRGVFSIKFLYILYQMVFLCYFWRYFGPYFTVSHHISPYFIQG